LYKKRGTLLALYVLLYIVQNENKLINNEGEGGDKIRASSYE
jgi:hypothetical protein